MTLSVVELRDASSGATARVLPGFGMNCFEFLVPHTGRLIDVLWAEEGFASGARRASGSGIPILFPFAGRIQGTSFEYEGESYPLEEGDGQGNAIHGFVLNRPWRIVEQTDDALTGEFQASTAEDETAPLRWPTDYRIRLSYRVRRRSLVIRVEIQNLSPRDMPVSFGLHPYFRVPLGGVDADACRVTAPASEYWELADMIATGRRLPVDDARDLRGGKPFGDLRLDDVLTGVLYDDVVATAKIDDPDGLSVKIEFGREFPHLVVYNPPHREAICLEPYSSLPDAVRLEQAGVQTGLWRLAPEETKRFDLKIEVE